MPVRASWAHERIVVPDGDPFLQRVEEVGVPIQLGEETAQLNERIAELVRTEGRLYNAGVRCTIKDRPDTSCSACPISAHNDAAAPLNALCRTGREQERVLTEMAVVVEADRAGDG